VRCRAEVLVSGFVSGVEQQALNEIGSKAADQDHYQHRQSLPEHWSTAFQCNRFDMVFLISYPKEFL
jgi:hypothetical protein